MNILFLTNLLPFPLDNGGKIKTYTTINALSHEGHNIDLVCFTESSEPQKKYEKKMLNLCRSVNQIYLRLTSAENKLYMIVKAARSLLSQYSFGLLKYQSKQMQQILRELCQTNIYDCIYFDHLQLCIYKDYLRELSPKAKMILDEHNCEALIMLRSIDVAHNIIKKIFLKLESRKLSAFESKMLTQIDEIIVLSKVDYNELKKQVKNDFKHTIIPIGVQDRGIKKNTEKVIENLNILFLGTLTWEPNNQGLIWFLSKVIPDMIKKKIPFTFYIIGKGPSFEVLELARQYENVIVTGYVESVDEYYDKCDCMVVPLFIGSGQRVKLIEGFSKGMPAISTSIGAEGLEAIDGQNIIIADTQDGFVNAINEMYSTQIRRHLSYQARKCYESYYSSDAVSSKLNIVIEYVEKELSE